ncbi:unnamed protein product, partial [Amoebophrya sp. A120]
GTASTSGVVDDFTAPSTLADNGYTTTTGKKNDILRTDDELAAYLAREDTRIINDLMAKMKRMNMPVPPEDIFTGRFRYNGGAGRAGNEDDKGEPRRGREVEALQGKVADEDPTAQAASTLEKQNKA